MNKLMILSVLSLVSLTACTDPKTAARAVRNVGLENFVATGYRFTGCSDDDTFATGFTAKNARGEQVTGVVCSGFLKGATVRFD